MTRVRCYEPNCKFGKVDENGQVICQCEDEIGITIVTNTHHLPKTEKQSWGFTKICSRKEDDPDKLKAMKESSLKPCPECNALSNEWMFKDDDNQSFTCRSCGLYWSIKNGNPKIGHMSLEKKTLTQIMFPKTSRIIEDIILKIQAKNGKDYIPKKPIVLGYESKGILHLTDEMQKYGYDWNDGIMFDAEPDQSVKWQGYNNFSKTE